MDKGVASMGARPHIGTFDTAEKRQKDALENKRTHFTLGNHPRIGYSQHRQMYVDHSKSHGVLKPVSNRVESCMTHFEVGEPKLRNAFFVTMYNQQTDANKYRGFIPQKQLENPSFRSSINVGFGRPLVRMSENTRTYQPHTGFRPPESDKEFIKHIKGNHFEFGNPQNNNLSNYYTISMGSFDYKGNAGNIKATLDQERKADLRRSHFNVGKES